MMENERIYRFTNKAGISADLHCFYNYDKADETHRNAVCNGAGPRRFGWLVPDTFWWLCITESANAHDWCYQWGETIEDKHQADRTFKNNMLRQAEALRQDEEAKASWWLSKKWIEYKHDRRLGMIGEYFKAVDSFGGPAFWDKTDVGFNWKEIG